VLLRQMHGVDTALQDLKIHTENTGITTAAIRDSMNSLRTETSAFRTEQERVLNDIANARPREGARTRDAMDSHAHGLNRIGDMISGHQVTVGRWMSAQAQLLQDVKTALPQETSKIDNRLDELMRITSSANSPPVVTQSKYMIAQKTEHLVARIVREEIRRTLRPVIEKLSQSHTRNDRLAETLQDVTDHLGKLLWDGAVLDQELGDRIPGVSPESTKQEDQTREPTFSNAVPLSDLEHGTELDHTNCASARDPYPASPQRPRHRPRKIWTYWTSFSWLGNIRVEIRQRKRRNRAGNCWSTDLFISVTFWPSWPLLRRRCISLLYTTEPSHNAYHQLMPMVAMFPVISQSAPVWRLVRRGNIRGLRHAFENGLASPNDQDEHGNTLVHVC
jgi:hypothetical protein